MTGHGFWAQEPDESWAAITHLLERPEWHARAACRGQVDTMFPKTRHNARAWDAALAVCVTCPVRRECHAAATHTGEVHGVWGGRRRSEPPGRTNLVAVMGDDWWTAEDLAVEIGTASNYVRRRLRRLAERGALEHRSDPLNHRRRQWRVAQRRTA